MAVPVNLNSEVEVECGAVAQRGGAATQRKGLQRRDAEDAESRRAFSLTTDGREINTARRNRNPTERPSTQRRRGRREPQSFFFNHRMRTRINTARRNRNPTERPSTQRRRGRREPQSFFFNHGWTRMDPARRNRNPTERPSTQRRRGRREPQSFFLNHGWTRINTDKGETRISRIDANSVGDNSPIRVKPGAPPLSDPCESVSIRGKKSFQKGTMS